MCTASKAGKIFSYTAITCHAGRARSLTLSIPARRHSARTRPTPRGGGSVIQKIKWNLVVFDEYHFESWHDTTKELFEGEDVAVNMKKAALGICRRP